jgi:hypothetical protein
VKIGLQLSLAFLIGIVLLWSLRACSPFAYLNEDEPMILKGGIER